MRKSQTSTDQTWLMNTALLGLVCLFLYYGIYRWIPLGQWNAQFHLPVTNDQFYPDLVIGALLLWFIWSFGSRLTAGMIAACVLLTLWVVMHAFDWWIPYMRDLPQNAARFSFYQSRTQLLPVVRHHYPPDAGHAVLDFLLYPTWLLTLFATLISRKRK